MSTWRTLFGPKKNAQSPGACPENWTPLSPRLSRPRLRRCAGTSAVGPCRNRVYAPRDQAIAVPTPDSTQLRAVAGFFTRARQSMHSSCAPGGCDVGGPCIETGQWATRVVDANTRAGARKNISCVTVRNGKGCACRMGLPLPREGERVGVRGRACRRRRVDPHPIPLPQSGRGGVGGSPLEGVTLTPSLSRKAGEGESVGIYLCSLPSPHPSRKKREGGWETTARAETT